MEKNEKIICFESKNVEFKKEIKEKATKEKVFKIMNSFSNTEGGTIYVGIDDERTILGICDNDVDEIKKVIDSHFKSKELITKITYFFKTIEIKEKRILMINILAGKSPIYEKMNGKVVLAIRLNSQTQYISEVEMVDFIISKIKTVDIKEYMQRHFELIGNFNWIINEVEFTKIKIIIDNLSKNRYILGIHEGAKISIDECRLIPIIKKEIIFKNNCLQFGIDWYGRYKKDAKSPYMSHIYILSQIIEIDNNLDFKEKNNWKDNILNYNNFYNLDKYPFIPIISELYSEIRLNEKGQKKIKEIILTKKNQILNIFQKNKCWIEKIFFKTLLDIN